MIASLPSSSIFDLESFRSNRVVDFFQRLLDGVGDFLQVDFAYHVKSVLGHGVVI